MLILVLAALATLLPSFATTWISYVENKRSLAAKAKQEVLSASVQTARELDLWLKERLYELRVFASSYEVTENVALLPRSRDRAEPSGSRERLTDYLRSVSERFDDYSDIRILDAEGRIVAAGAEPAEAVTLPADWQAQIRNPEFVVGKTYWNEASGAPEMVIAVPIRTGEEAILGLMTATVDLQAFADTLRRFVPGEAGQVSLLTEEGSPVTSSADAGAALTMPRYDAELVRARAADESEASEFVNAAGEQVVGHMRQVPGLDWVVVAEIPAAEVYGELARLRNSAFLIAAATLVLAGGLGYVLGLLIVRPLDRLTKAAAKVAGGNLEVDLPVARGEIGYLTEVFKNMVVRLRAGRQELERLSVTDALTGLSNRRRMTEVLRNEVLRSQRLKHTFAVLMTDVDHFKGYNDAHGHPAGDELLKQLATILRTETRDVDLVARYGGEEFLVLLPETKARGAADLAERIRRRLETLPAPAGHVTVSIGVAEFPLHGDTGEKLIAVADAALYEAKRGGRNRVIVAATPIRAVRG
ncbi:MAG TPA: diguanylate cyclase [Gammaproteobacteria bacterium]|nr:diguanylate cyclase [Gammaproteobacteria bacterium]